MFDNNYDIEQTESEATPIARCAECGELIYDDSSNVYMDADQNYFCSLECSLNYYGIHQSEDCLVGE